MKTASRFGEYGGMYVSELLAPTLLELAAEWQAAREDPGFQAEFKRLLAEYAGRPTPLYASKALSRKLGCAAFLKREDLLHGGAHKTNNTIGQGLLALRMGKRQLIAETGAGQHGVATAMAGAVLGLPVKVFMGAKDVERQQPNVARMKLFGAEVVSVEQGSRSLKDAINECLRYWTGTVDESFYVFGTVAGPHPFPSIVRDYQRVIGEEIARQMPGGSPDVIVACVGGGSNAIGAFAEFLDDPAVRLVGVEAAGRGLDSGAHGATLTKGRPGVLHGSYSYVLQDEHGQIEEAHSVSAGLDYPGIGPEHAHLKDIGRVEYVSATDVDAVAAAQWMCRNDGILPALETSHAIAWLLDQGGQFRSEDRVVLNLSGRGDKDLSTLLEAGGLQ
jgi:tryptophan synthase beta chain